METKELEEIQDQDDSGQSRQKTQVFVKDYLGVALKRSREMKQQIPFGKIPLEFRLSTPNNKLAEVVVEDGIRKIIFSWAIIARAPPALLIQLTLLEEILHYYYPAQDEFVHSVIDQYISSEIYESFINAIEKAGRVGIYTELTEEQIRRESVEGFVLHPEVKETWNLTLIKPLQELYARAGAKEREDIVKKFKEITGAACIVLGNWADENGIPMEIKRTTFEGRLEGIQELLKDLLESAARGEEKYFDIELKDLIKRLSNDRLIIRDEACSDGITTMELAQSLIGFKDKVKIIGADILMNLYQLANKDGDVAIFDAFEKIMQVKRAGELKQVYKDEEFQKLFEEICRLSQRLYGRLVSFESEGNKLDVIRTLDPRVVDFEKENNQVSFQEHDVFASVKEKADVICCANLLLYGEYFTLERIQEAVYQLGNSLNEGGILILAQTPVHDPELIYIHLYQRKGDRLLPLLESSRKLSKIEYARFAPSPKVLALFEAEIDLSESPAFAPGAIEQKQLLSERLLSHAENDKNEAALNENREEKARSPEEDFTDTMQEAYARLKANGAADIVVGIPFINEKETAGKVVRKIANSLAKLYPDKRILFVCVGEKDGKEAQRVINSVSLSANARSICFLKSSDSIRGKGWSVRAAMEIAQKLQANLYLFDADLQQIPFRWVNVLAQPLEEEQMDLVMSQYTSSYAESLIS
ncbi:MAG: hypothetical protein KJ838_03925, partial [Candidatus Omnitrophica bacterium]|nr:hypothetical protein [Candidatus Omnitrophota bacterium]